MSVSDLRISRESKKPVVERQTDEIDEYITCGRGLGGGGAEMPNLCIIMDEVNDTVGRFDERSFIVSRLDYLSQTLNPITY